MTDSVRTAPAPMLRPEESRVVWLLLAAAFVAILNETTMGVAIPHVAEDLGVTENAAQWLTTAFMLTMAVVIPTTGFLIKRFTTRQVFVTAMSLFSLGTLIAAIAPAFPVLIGARVVQASGTAIMMPLLMTTLMTIVPPQSRGRMMGRVSIVISFAPAIGPVMSGVISEALSWRVTFGIVLPIALIALAVGAKWIHNLGERTHAPLDLLSVVLSAFGFGGLVYGLSQIGGGHGGSASAETAAPSSMMLIVPIAIGLVALALFVWRQLRLQRIDDALLDLRVFRTRNFTLSILQATIMSMAFFGTIIILPLYMQNVLGMSSTAAGFAVLPGAILMGVAAPFIGRIYDAKGTQVLLVPGAVLVVGTLWVFTTFDENVAVWAVVVAQTVLSLGLAMSFTPLFTAALGSLDKAFISYGSAIINTVQQVAGAAGIAVMVTLMTTTTAAQIADGVDAAAAGAAGTHMAFLVSAIIAIPLLVGAFLITKPADTPGEPVDVGH